ncbi:hypothetical protein CGJ15_24570 [Vibrio parahaemolyticus]|nr:hypothetical protein CGJ15_24570 [Vibrio parahaemolyticus]
MVTVLAGWFRVHSPVPGKYREGGTRLELVSEGEVGVLTKPVEVSGGQVGVQLQELILVGQWTQ